MAGMLTRRDVLHAGTSLSLLRQQGTTETNHRKPLVAFRVGSEQWMRDERFQELLKLLRKFPGMADELALFTGATHAPLPLSEVERRTEILAKRIPIVRENGMGAGINVLATMGHHEENLEASLNEPWQTVIDPHGRTSKGSYCPADPRFLEYAKKIYVTLIQAAPDFIWIDDDVRLSGHMPIGYTCFCNACVGRFSSRVGRVFTRQTLLAAFASGPLPDRLSIRRSWLDHNREMIDNLFRAIERAVHSAKPGLSLGFMTGDRFYEGYDFARWAQTLAGPGHHAVRWRPGGGFYTDESLDGLIEKAHFMGRQVAQLPPQVQAIQSEVENFPYHLLQKSAEATVTEGAAYMAAGTTGTAFNVLPLTADPLDEYEPLLRRIARTRPFYERISSEVGRSPCVGVWPAWNRDVFVANNTDGDWLAVSGDVAAALRRVYSLGEIGIPLCYGFEHSCATALAGAIPLAFTKDELRQIFAGGVLMDVEAWRAVHRLGLSRWTGVEAGEKYGRDTIEVLAEHRFSGDFGGRFRDCRQSFWWREDAYSLLPIQAEVEVLARLVDYQGRDRGISMTACQNELGGRVVVMGYFPWSQFHGLAKSVQMKNICGWLSKDHLPVVLDSLARVHIWVRKVSRNRLVCILLNSSLDAAKDLTLRIKPDFQLCQWLTIDGRKGSLPVNKEPGKGSTVMLPPLQAWSVGLLVLSEP